MRRCTFDTLCCRSGEAQLKTYVNHIRFNWRRNGPHLLILAAALHLVCTLMLFVAGRLQLFPSLLDRNGTAISFAPDSKRYLIDAAFLGEVLRNEGLSAWIGASFPSHAKLYSVTFALLGPLMGSNILTAEPLNLACYLIILWLVFKLASRAFDKRVGFITSAIVAAWPTFLLHTTQVLKEPIFIAAILALILVISGLLTSTSGWLDNITSAGLAGALVPLVWIVRADLWILYLAFALVGVILLLLRMARERKFLGGSLLVAGFILAITTVVPSLITPYRNPNPHPLLRTDAKARVDQETQAGSNLPDSIAPASSASNWPTQVRERIVWARYLFKHYQGTGSNIDEDVRLESWGAVVRYLPRAMVVGFFAPFPDMWFLSGNKVGLAGRILAGSETVLLYGCELLAFWGLWKNRAYLVSWFLALVVIIGVTSLALVMPNVGALYRFRYAFVVLLIMMSVDSGLKLHSLWTCRRQEH